RLILRNGNLSWSIVPGFSEFPEDQQPQNTIVYNPNIIGTIETIPVEGITFNPETRFRYARFRIQTSDSNFAIQPHYLGFVKNGMNKTNSSRWVWYNVDGRLFNNENISFIDLQNAVLPVELTSFTATIIQTKVKLNWQTATEINNQGFEVQRKLEGSEWITVSFRQGQGTTTESTQYFYEDDISEINTSKLYYRLKQIDFDGTFTYTDEVEVIAQPLEFSIYQNYPNPFNPSTKIRYSIPNVTLSEVEGSRVILKIYDILGNEVVTLVNEKQAPGYKEIDFNGSKLASGVYIYRLTAADFVSVKKMMIVK
ncbi:MAG: T9SS type A sorting domain-containing protein, partial [Ignavibacteria bacterium]|nr:T9SS type A sorting domain-containing protein [Ignavibacteria bacterium]